MFLLQTNAIIKDKQVKIKITQSVAKNPERIKKLVKIKQIVKMVQPKKTDVYINAVSNAIISASEKYGVDINCIMATGYIESEFDKNSQSGVGIMQLNDIWRDVHGNKMNPYAIRDNIYLGTSELKRHYLSSRSYNQRDRMIDMWGRYNGSGKHGKYAKKALIVYNRLKTKNIQELHSILSKKQLWKN